MLHMNHNLNLFLILPNTRFSHHSRRPMVAEQLRTTHRFSQSLPPGLEATHSYTLPITTTLGTHRHSSLTHKAEHNIHPLSPRYCSSSSPRGGHKMGHLLLLQEATRWAIFFSHLHSVTKILFTHNNLSSLLTLV